jgi:hypothetical protein
LHFIVASDYQGAPLETAAAATRVAAASNALARRLDQAHKATARLRQIDPTLRVSDLRQMLPFRRAEDSRDSKKACEKRGAGVTELALNVGSLRCRNLS